MHYPPLRVNEPVNPDRDNLPRELNAFLVELSVALHKYGMYPSEHPSLEPVAAAVVTRASQLLARRGQIAIGVARKQLVVEGAASDPEHPVLRRLAEGLHRHQLGALIITPGIDAGEVNEALRALSQEPEQSGPLGQMSARERPAWPHLQLHSLSFDGLAFVEEAPEISHAAPGGSEGTSGAELWIGLARAAMANDPREPESANPDTVAEVVNAHPRLAAYDHVIVSYLRQIARALRTSPGAETVVLQHGTARFIGALRPDTLRRLVEMGGDVAQRRAFVLEAAHGMAVDAVIAIVKAAAEASGQTISHGLVRMLSKLAAQAEFGGETARPMADAALRDQVEQLLNGWQLADPNPDEYGQLLQHVSTSVDEGRTLEAAAAAHQPSGIRLVQISLESGATGPMLARAIDRAIADGQMAALLDAFSSRPNGSGAAAEALPALLMRPATLRALLQQSPVDFESLDQLQPFMALDGYDVMLDALATTDNRTTRRKLLERLAQAPVDLGPMIMARLEDDRWFVQRNMLVLLERAGSPPDGFSPARWTAHPDVRVRHEAIRLQLKVAAERDLAVRAALEDGHPRLAHSGLAAIQQDCPSSVADLVCALAVKPDADEGLRVLATRALGRCDDRRALQTLIDLTDGGRTLLGRRRLAARSPVMLAALESMGAGWRSDGGAAAILRLAAEAADPGIRQAAQAGAR